MKCDLNALMAAHDVDGVIITGPAQHNPAMVYMTGGGHLTTGDLIQKQGDPAVLYHAPMERDEATRTGLKTVNYNQFSMKELLREASGDRIQAVALRYKQMLASQGLTSGRVLLYGQGDAGTHMAIFSAVQKVLPDLEFVSEPNGTLLMEAMATKDEEEVGRIRKMGKITTEVVGRVHDYLGQQSAKEGILLDHSGLPVTIGRVKGMINSWLAELGAENPEGTIFAQGRDSAVPHSTGDDKEALRLGASIVFDIYPCEAGGGYFYDFTRTWCLGYAPDSVYALYEDVFSVYNKITEEYQVGEKCGEYQKRACDLFEAQGHPTIQSNPVTEDGYVHSLGHGVGLHIHEQPWFSYNNGTEDVIRPGSVFTLEPGLYYPTRAAGVRLEDTLWVSPEGRIERLADYPMDLVIPLK